MITRRARDNPSPPTQPTGPRSLSCRDWGFGLRFITKEEPMDEIEDLIYELIMLLCASAKGMKR